MNAEAMASALNAIHEVAELALCEEMSAEAKKKLTLIMSIAKYRFDVRNSDEYSKNPDGKS